MIKFIAVNKSYTVVNKSLESVSSVDSKNKNNIKITALKDINLTVNRGEIFGIIGTSGAGKSTLLHMVNKLEVPDSGEVWLNNRLVNNLEGQALKCARQETGMIFQHFNLLESYTCYENIIFPLKINNQLKNLSKQELANKVNPILELTGLTHLTQNYPHQLSGGQKQRVGIARSLITNPKVLLSDECTSALDPQTTKAILNLLKKINNELAVTILLITHEMAVVKSICNNVAVMAHGEILEQGNVLDLFANPQHERTKKILSTNLLDKLPEAILKNLVNTKNHVHGNNGNNQGENLFPLIQLVFVDRSAAKPVLSEVMGLHNINFNILQGEIETIQNTIVGKMIMQVESNQGQLQKIQSSFSDRGIQVEILGYAPRIY